MSRKKMFFLYNPHAGKSQIKSKLADIINVFMRAGYVIQVYSVHYDLATGEEISRTLVDSCSYSRRNEIIIRIEQGEDVMNPDEPQ